MLAVHWQWATLMRLIVLLVALGRCCLHFDKSAGEGGGGREFGHLKYGLRQLDALDEERQKGGEEGHVEVALDQVLAIHALLVPEGGGGGHETR